MGDLYTPFRNYVKRMLTFQGKEKGTAKVLILDSDTVFYSLFFECNPIDAKYIGCFLPD